MSLLIIAQQSPNTTVFALPGLRDKSIEPSASPVNPAAVGEVEPEGQRKTQSSSRLFHTIKLLTYRPLNPYSE